MAEDKIRQRYEKKKLRGLLEGWSRRTVDPDLLTEEEKILQNTRPVDPIASQPCPGRNDPCPCGSGKKYKKCCEGKENR